MNVIMMTSVHSRYDTRIFIKECQSLAKNKYFVTLIVADGLGDEFKEGIRIIDVGKLRGRFRRIVKTSKSILKIAVKLDGDIYHFHDPELIPIGLKLKKLGKKVVYDVHEDVPRQIIGKPYLNKFIRPLIAMLFELYENYSIKKFDIILAATPFICDRLSKFCLNVIDINNYPIIGELNPSSSMTEGKKYIAYVGDISEIRGIKQMVNALENCISKVVLKLAGNFSPQSLRNEVTILKGWQSVEEIGYADRNTIKEIFKFSIAGLVIIQPENLNVKNGLPVKMFEYMSAGLPIICSDFPIWKSIIESNKCGVCVDPTDPLAIAKAIDYMFENPKKAREMGENGLNAVHRKFNWGIEESKLLEKYNNLI